MRRVADVERAPARSPLPPATMSADSSPPLAPATPDTSAPELTLDPSQAPTPPAPESATAPTLAGEVASAPALERIESGAMADVEEGTTTGELIPCPAVRARGCGAVVGAGGAVRARARVR